MNEENNNLGMNLTGKKIRQLRIQKNLTLRDVSDKLEELNVGVDFSNLAKMENGERAINDIVLYNISKILNVDVNSLFEDIK